MRKALCIAVVFVFITNIIACDILGFEENSSPVIATMSGTGDESVGEASFVPLESSEEEISPSSDDVESSVENSVDESVDDSSAEPEPVRTYIYKGFTVVGYAEEDIADFVDKVLKTMESTKSHISIYYKDINSGYSISYDEDKNYKAGSVTKAPYCKFLISRGVNLDEELTMTSYDVTDGSGVLKYQPVGSKHKVKALIEYAVKESDNIAYRMLWRRYGFDGFNEYCRELGIDINLSIYDVWGDLSAREAMLFFEDIWNFEINDSKSNFFMDALRNASYNYLLPSGSGGVPVAHKYGYMSAIYKVLHDAGIVYADAPYIAVILSDINPKANNWRTPFIQISTYFKEFADFQKNIEKN